jgi:predicted RNase H-like nuclease (RuvC/YqgF family)
MKNIQTIIIILLAVLAIIFGIVWMNAAKKNKALVQSNEDLKTLYESSTATIGEIQSSLESLDEDLSGQLFTQSEIPDLSPEDRRERIISSIANMREQIEADKKKIAQLEAQLASSRTQLRGVQEIVDRLKASIEEKETIMAELQDRLGIMTETIEEERRLSQMEIAAREQTIQEKEEALDEAAWEANTIYYTVGKRSELMDLGVIDRKGGILGIGRVTLVAKSLETDDFNEINLLETAEIRFPATKKGYSILSNHVATTYEVDKVEDEYILYITDPENFRKQKFLVIELL